MRRLTLAALLAPLPAFAHPGHAIEDPGFVAGVLHPLLGLDHLVAMVAIGLWAGLLGGRLRWLLPAGFLAGMAAGGALGLAGMALPMVEAGILASLIVIGACLGAAARLPVPAALALLGVFGVLHGHAHGAELAGQGALAAAIGALLATALLHGAGVLAAGRATGTRRLALRVAGGAACCAVLAVTIAA